MIVPVVVTQEGILHTEFTILDHEEFSIPENSPLLIDQNLLCVQSDSARCTSTSLVKTSVPCTSSLADINMNELTSVHDNSFTRTYILCPLKTSIVDDIDDDDDDWALLIMGRPNMRLLCGADGKVANECTVHGGANKLRFEDPFHDEGQPSTENIHVQGITFSTVSLINVSYCLRTPIHGEYS
jgi:hypothetical protein